MEVTLKKIDESNFIDCFNLKLSEEYNIWHMMIDEKYQGKGYGKAAMYKCLELIGTKPFGNSNRVVLTCDEMNGKAIGLYRSLGFVPTGGQDEDEIELVLMI